MHGPAWACRHAHVQLHAARHSGHVSCSSTRNFANAATHACSYTEISDVQKLIAVVEDYLKDFNATSKRPMNLAMFLFAVEHVSRICR